MKKLDRTIGVEAAAAAADALGCAYVMLGHGKFALCDHGDYPEVSKYVWHCNKRGYADTLLKGFKNRHLLMHALIMQAPLGMETDHRNTNKLDNRRENLRAGTHRQNIGNTEKRDGNYTSHFKGVCWDASRNKWRATGVEDRIPGRSYGKAIHLGRFSTEIEAAIAYNTYAISKFGEFARLNPV